MDRKNEGVESGGIFNIIFCIIFNVSNRWEKHNVGDFFFVNPLAVSICGPRSRSDNPVGKLAVRPAEKRKYARNRVITTVAYRLAFPDVNQRILKPNNYPYPHSNGRLHDAYLSSHYGYTDGSVIRKITRSFIP